MKPLSGASSRPSFETKTKAMPESIPPKTAVISISETVNFLEKKVWELRDKKGLKVFDNATAQQQIATVAASIDTRSKEIELIDKEAEEVSQSLAWYKSLLEKAVANG